MNRKDRIKTYLTGVIIGVLLLFTWQIMKSVSNRQNAPPAGVPSAPAAASGGTETAADAEPEGEQPPEDDTPDALPEEASRRTP